MAALRKIYNLRSGRQEFKASELQFVQKTGTLGRKRVVVSGLVGEADLGSAITGERIHKRCQRGLNNMERSNRIEDLPQDIMVRILCKVNHSDLKKLLLVSKSVHEATLVAKELHFAFSTPTKSAVNKIGDFGVYELEAGVESLETPKAPQQHRVAKSRLDGKKLGSIAVALFASPEF